MENRGEMCDLTVFYINGRTTKYLFLTSSPKYFFANKRIKRLFTERDLSEQSAIALKNYF